MSKIINPEILVAHFQCPRKAFLLMFNEPCGSEHEYIQILRQLQKNNQQEYIDILCKKNLNVQLYNKKSFLNNNASFLINATLEINGLICDCTVLTKANTHSIPDQDNYEPTIFTGVHSVTKEDNYELLFICHILEQIQNKRPIHGRIITLEKKSHSVKIGNNIKNIIPTIETLQLWASTPSLVPPPIILKKHCQICQFLEQCHAQAKQEDNLSLLDKISTQKIINKYEKKGIFTVKQLSYVFKPRKRKSRTKNRLAVIYKPELQALAIRDRKIYLQELPELSRQPVELYLDIEGVPDRKFYYLIGLLVCENLETTYYSFWADNYKDEGLIWQQFLKKVSEYPHASIYHYGSYDAKAITNLIQRYSSNVDNLLDRLININRYIFGKIYFPVYSNRLKDIGSFIGANWTSPDASGLQSLVWRNYWDLTRNIKYKELLMTYNAEDCQALKLLIDELCIIKDKADFTENLNFGDRHKSFNTKAGNPLHGQLETILKFASSKYDKNKIKFSQHYQIPKDNKEKRTKQSKKKRALKRTKIQYQPTNTVLIPKGEFCPKCENSLLHPSKATSERKIIDFVLTSNGVMKTITKYIAAKGYCPKCRVYRVPPDMQKFERAQIYEHGLRAWFVYYRVARRLSYQDIADMTEEQFHIRISKLTSIRFLEEFASYYNSTEQEIIQYLLKSPFVQVDETKINIEGVNWYVWVFTNGEYVVFKLTETRETKIVRELLSDYKGVLISDFYTGYDSIKCKQQKCWVHLIRDINDDLWKSPYDTEFEYFVSEVRNLIIPIMEAVQKYGLTKLNLSKFLNQVNMFYDENIAKRRYKSDLTIKYQKRFKKYRERLFTFLEQDGIPWHNNIAETAIRHIAIQRKISGHFYEAITRDYLLLLSIKQTCRFQGKSFFRFLFSKQTDLEKFDDSVAQDSFSEI